MSIVVRELIIRARVEDSDCASGKNGQNRQNGKVSAVNDEETERIVALCTEKVMEALERKKER